MAVKENRPQHGPLDLDLDYIYVMMAWHAREMTMETNSYTQISFVYAKSNRDPFHLYFQVCLLEIMEWEECPCLCDVPKWIRAFSYTSKVLTTIGKLLPLASPPYPRVGRTQKPDHLWMRCWRREKISSYSEKKWHLPFSHNFCRVALSLPLVRSS